MTFLPGDLILVSFPYSDLSTTKRRPVLVLTAPDGRSDFICLAVTSVPTAEHAIILDYDALIDGDLPKRSWVRTDKIFTLNTKLVKGVFAQTSPSFFKQILKNLCNILGLDQDATFIDE
ncbi:MAG: type II toxin-antitoxin system PemK/MazF family toxin [Magnetococcales bacterium]|nr:type II toxin-antitoxin system PemK/MazF family toxin [Magnetococcales bacterium]